MHIRIIYKHRIRRTVYFNTNETKLLLHMTKLQIFIHYRSFFLSTVFTKNTSYFADRTHRLLLGCTASIIYRAFDVSHLFVSSKSRFADTSANSGTRLANSIITQSLVCTSRYPKPSKPFSSSAHTHCTKSEIWKMSLKRKHYCKTYLPTRMTRLFQPQATNNTLNQNYWIHKTIVPTTVIKTFNLKYNKNCIAFYAYHKTTTEILIEKI